MFGGLVFYYYLCNAIQNKSINQLKELIMVNNIFANGTVFYTPIDGDIYACRFKRLFLEINAIFAIRDDQTINIGDYDNCDISICGAVLEIANRTEPVTFGTKGIDPCRIYRTVDDCLSDVKPLFFKQGDRLKLNVIIICNMGDELCPSNAFWTCVDKTERGDWFKLHTFRWIDLKAQEVPFKGPSSGEQYPYIFVNDSKPVFDMVKCEWIVDALYNVECFSSRTECINAHPVKVHMF